MSGCYPSECNCNQSLSNSIQELCNRVEALHTHKIRQIDENRKISKRVDELELLVNAIKESYNNLCAPALKKIPYKCPVCDGCGNDKGATESNPNYEFCMRYASCHSCKGSGIVWG
jgi:hypothetical protein